MASVLYLLVKSDFTFIGGAEAMRPERQVTLICHVSKETRA